MLLFSLLVFGLGTLLGFLNYWHNEKRQLAVTQDFFIRTAAETEQHLHLLKAPVKNSIAYLSRSRLALANDLSSRLENLPLLIEILEQNPALEAVYAGYADGDFFVASPFNDRHHTPYAKPPANPEVRYVVRSIENNIPDAPPHAHTLFLNQNLEILERRNSRNDSFDPRTRPWYQAAITKDETITIGPYPFIITEKIGESIARRSKEGDFVAGASITLDEVSLKLRESPIVLRYPSAHLILFDESENIVAHSINESFFKKTPEGAFSPIKLGDFPDPMMQAVRASFKEGVLGKPVTIEAGQTLWTTITLHAPQNNGTHLYLTAVVPEHELFADARRQLKEDGLITLAIILLLLLPVSWYISRHVSRSLRILTEQAKAVHHLNFSTPKTFHSIIREVRELSKAADHADLTIRRFLEITSALAHEGDFQSLMQLVLQETLKAVDGTVGILYLVSPDGTQLTPEALSYLQEDKNADSAPQPSTLELLEELPAIPLHHNGVDPVALSALQKTFTAVNLTASAFGDRLNHLLRPFPAHMIATPLQQGSSQEVIGVLCLCRKNTEKDPTPELRSFVEKLSGVVAVSIANRRLLSNQTDLLNGLIQLIAQAIDSKSPYTGGHCQRVPELTQMLAQAACDQTSGYFADYQLDAEGWEALRIGTWLHDCGKVTTPEYVVDKATKLETIYDRIHEIRMRFEVLKRDCAITYWQSCAQGRDEAEARKQRDQEWAQLDEEFQFIATCNRGEEFMAPEKIERLHLIAQRTWTRTLSDRIGISRAEARRKIKTPEPRLPTTELLLANKPEHLIEWETDRSIPENNPWGFRMQVPEYEYNLGELNNLSIRYGTLTQEERYKINDHIIQTIIMLSCLPLPKHLRSVPEIAGGHHEKMNGGGYPKGLTRENMSIEARMVAIADIFEALTAADRPYKKRKKLSEALEIMAKMTREAHLDADIFELFLRSGVYRQYAQSYLRPDQLDEVDIEQLLASALPPAPSSAQP